MLFFLIWIPLIIPAGPWGLKKAGYATNPRYAAALIKTIEDYGLQDYTLWRWERFLTRQLIPVVTESRLMKTKQ